MRKVDGDDGPRPLLAAAAAVRREGEGEGTYLSKSYPGRWLLTPGCYPTVDRTRSVVGLRLCDSRVFYVKSLLSLMMLMMNVSDLDA